MFGQKPTFGGFGASTAQTGSFGSSFQQTQPAFGNSPFGSSTPFGSGTQPSFGTPSTPTFGSSPAFGATAPTFGTTSTQAFGATTPAFGSTVNPTFGTTTGAFGVSSSPAFGSTTSSFGAPTTSAFGVATSAPAFGATPSTPAFGASSSAFSFTNSSPSFGQPAASPFGQPAASPFGQPAASSPSFGQSTSPFTSSPFGSQATAPPFGGTGFGQSTFGTQQGGSRAVPYSATPEDGSAGAKLESISAMQAYKEKSHEELRWEDYQRGDKGGPAPAAQSTPGLNFGSPGFGTATTTAFGQTTPSNPFSTTTQSNPFAPKPSSFTSPGFGTSSSAFGSSPFGTSTTTANPFSSTQTTPSLFTSSPSFGPSVSPSPFSSSTSSFGTSTSLFGGSSAQTNQGSSGSLFGNTQSPSLFQSTTPSLGQTNSPFGQSTTPFGQSTPSFTQPSLFNPPSSGFGANTFSSTPSLLTNNSGFGQGTPSISTPFQPVQTAQSGSSFSFGNYGQTTSAGISGFGTSSNMFGQNTFGQPSTVQAPVVPQAVSTNPFGTLPAMPQISIGRTGTSPSIQYGISSMPVVDKPAPARISSILTSRHLSQRRIRLPARRYHPQTDGPKVPFFCDDEETPSKPKADALYIPRENPRALVIRPVEQQQSQMSAGKTILSKNTFSATHENGKTPEAGPTPSMNGFSNQDKVESIENGFEERTLPKQCQKPNGTSDSLSVAPTGHRAGEAAIAYEHGPEIEALMPKLRHSDYYTEPRIQELAAKERVENGYCQRVKDFVVGRHGYGSIKFIGETDVRGLDLESLIQFNNREVIVYMDESKKPPVGQGLNKRAEVTLLNIKCFDKKTGLHYTEGPRIEKYKEMLRRKAEDQGAEFVSYDPVKGEWKFRVEHFSKYTLIEEEGDEDLLNLA
ncbi:OLC1v1028809C4 [Oldenlandia corymbosa var. corymbosa]|nr:OLC1v1028809C4 [Oldenlandia corymbosa var. corymbosa]